MNGWRPISVTNQPATVATQPENVIAANAPQQRTRQACAAPSCCAGTSTTPSQLVASISTPMPTITRNAQNTGSTGGWRSRKLVQALDLAVELVAQDEAGQLGDRDLEVVLALVAVGDGKQQQRRAALGVPQAFHRRDLLRLVLQRVQPMLVADEDLQRDQHAPPT